jgi:hypothetical protein
MLLRIARARSFITCNSTKQTLTCAVFADMIYARFAAVAAAAAAAATAAFNYLCVLLIAQRTRAILAPRLTGSPLGAHVLLQACCDRRFFSAR